jgi:hypothetical protein
MGPDRRISNLHAMLLLREEDMTAKWHIHDDGFSEVFRSFSSRLTSTVSVVGDLEALCSNFREHLA